MGGVAVRTSDFKECFFGESFVEEVKLIDKAGQSLDASIRFEFKLSPIAHSHIRLR